MKTAFLHMAQYEGLAVILIDRAAKDCFSHLSLENLVRKFSAGDLTLPLVRMDDGHRSEKGVALVDLASYLDARIETARRKCFRLNGRVFFPTP